MEEHNSLNDTLKNINASIIAEINGVAFEVWTFDNRTVNVSNLPDLNLTPVLEAINETNQSIFGKLFSLMMDHQDILGNLSEINTSLTDEINNVHLDVWSSPNRTLTSLDNVTVTGNVSVDPAQIWDFPNRTLTEFCPDTDSVGRCVYEFFFRAGAVV